MAGILENFGDVRPTDSASGRHTCRFSGCSKNFLRREHLTRHEKSHTDPRSFVCHICQRGFTRNDILQRHLSRHKDSTGTTERSGRACDTCHASKIRCEGGLPCFTCTRRGIDCRFDRDDSNAAKEIPAQDNGSRQLVPNSAEVVGNNSGQYVMHSDIVLDDSSLPMMVLDNSETHDEDMRSGTNQVDYHTIANGNAHTSSPDRPMNLRSMRLNAQATSDSSVSLNTPSQFPSANSQISAQSNGSPSTVQDEQSFTHRFEDHGFPWTSKTSLVPTRSVPGSITKDYYEMYLAHFHHRWPIIHVPTFEKGDDPYMLQASVEMMGAWLHGTCPDKVVALTLYDRLSSHVFQKLYQTQPFNDRYKAWPMTLYQAAILNVIFGLYVGKDDITSRGVLLYSVLLSTLREVGFFIPEIAELQQKDASFLPYLMSKREERKRLATTLLKLDCYLSIIRSQPMMLRPDELNFTLPCTFTSWNAPGLHLWQKRYPDEPAQREKETMYSMIHDSHFSSVTQPFLMVEDIQFGICCIQSDVWHYRELIQSGREDDMSNLIHKKTLRKRLDSWKHILDRTLVQEEDPRTGNHSMGTNFIPMKYYFGVEDHANPDWKDIVLYRPQSLLADTTILYHLLSLNIHANIRSLTALARSKRDSANTSIPHATKASEDAARQWTRVICGRGAVWHATNVLAMFRSRTGGGLMTPLKLVNGGLDPVAHVAVSMSSLVVWAYSLFNSSGCDACAGPPFVDGVGVMDLLACMEGEALGRTGESEKWIEAGGRASIDGLVLCRCHIERLMEKFAQCLPTGGWKWEMADTLSGVFTHNKNNL